MESIFLNLDKFGWFCSQKALFLNLFIIISVFDHRYIPIVRVMSELRPSYGFLKFSGFLICGIVCIAIYSMLVCTYVTRIHTDINAIFYRSRREEFFISFLNFTVLVRSFCWYVPKLVCICPNSKVSRVRKRKITVKKRDV